MVRLGRTGSFTNNKSGSESENMDRDPNFSGSSGGGRRPTRHSGRRIIDGDDSSIRRSGVRDFYFLLRYYTDERLRR